MKAIPSSSHHLAVLIIPAAYHAAQSHISHDESLPGEYDLSLASVQPDWCYRSPLMQPDLLHLRAPSPPLP